ncbi:MAG: ATP-binding protein [Bacteroidota bacterium]
MERRLSYSLRMKNWLTYRPVETLFGALVIFCSIFGVIAHFTEAGNDEPFSEQEIEVRLHSVLSDVENLLNRYTQRLERNEGYVNFDDFLEVESEYPVFIFRDQQLVFWSDHRIDFSLEDLSTAFRTQAVRLKHGSFVVRRQTVPINSITYQLFALIPLQYNYRTENAFLSNSPNSKIFPTEELKIQLGEEKKGVRAPEGNTLFSVRASDKEPTKGHSQQALWFISALFFGTLGLARWALRKLPWKTLLGISLGLLVLRLLGYQLTLPETWWLSELFQPQYFAWSEFAPSLGDLLLNVGLLLALLWLWKDQIIGRDILYRPALPRVLLALLFWIASFGALYLQFETLNAVYQHSSISLDITKSLSAAWPRLTSWLVFLVLSAAYFLSSVLCWRQLSHLFTDLERDVLNYTVLSGSLITLLFAVFALTGISKLAILLFVGLHTLLGYTFINNERQIWRGSFSAFLMIAALMLLQAWLGAHAIAEAEQEKAEQDKTRFAEQILQENDGFGEVLLNDAARKIATDPLVKQYLRFRAITPEQVIRKKITRFYLGSYFDKYDTEVHFYDRRQRPYADAPSLDSLRQRIAQPKFGTTYPKIFFVSSFLRELKKYYVFIDTDAGHVVLELRLKKYVPSSIYPNLLLDNAYMTPRLRGLSYAIFQDSVLLYHTGQFAYNRRFLEQLNEEFRQQSFSFADYRHRHIRRSDRDFIISTPKYSWGKEVSNFSFLFLLQIFFALPMLFIYRLVSHKSLFAFRFSTKIQLYLNAAFFVPLLIVGILIVGLLNSESRREIEQTYREKSEIAARNLADVLKNFKTQRDTLPAARVFITPLAEKLAEVSRLTGTEIHLFDTKGELIVSNQPALYDSYLLAPRVNPEALATLVYRQQNFLITDESIGKLDYNAVYVDVEAAESGEPLAILGMPFFESGVRTEQQIIDILTIILNVFTLIFILLLGFSYVVSNRLTRPLELIREKMQQVSLREKNQPLTYQADDEIGALIKEYNKMIFKLEESKQALARTEKESAWREMAKQVAHEIKNPLTPMKLTLQHLQRSMRQENGAAEAPIKTLLTQIDTLSDIANSFSVFAKMPIPKEEVFELSQVVEQTVALYENHDRALVKTEITPHKFWVRADPQLIGRILTNLILNGIQAVPEEEIARIEVRLILSGTKTALLTVHDNGCGIPEENYHKIFIPSFTTKSSGSGIGLAVAKKGIEHAGGNIWLESEMDRGTTFFVELPLV